MGVALFLFMGVSGYESIWIGFACGIARMPSSTLIPFWGGGGGG